MEKYFFYSIMEKSLTYNNTHIVQNKQTYYNLPKTNLFKTLNNK